jgi:hypothetical protein
MFQDHRLLAGLTKQSGYLEDLNTPKKSLDRDAAFIPLQESVAAFLRSLCTAGRKAHVDR